MTGKYFVISIFFNNFQLFGNYFVILNLFITLSVRFEFDGAVRTGANI